MEHLDSIVVGVTGGMGSGQTTVCQFMEKFGAKSINADVVAKKVIENNDEVRKELKKIFGSKIFYQNGKLNRKLLAHLAFSDEARTERLNRTVHPHMVSRIVTMIEETRESGNHPVICVDAALIYELSLEHMFDAIIVVSSAMNNRVARIKNRDNLSDKEILDRINKQIPLEEKTKWADYVIKNDRDLQTLEKDTEKVYKRLENLVNKKRRAQRKVPTV